MRAGWGRALCVVAIGAWLVTGVALPASAKRPPPRSETDEGAQVERDEDVARAVQAELAKATAAAAQAAQGVTTAESGPRGGDALTPARAAESVQAATTADSKSKAGFWSSGGGAPSDPGEARSALAAQPAGDGNSANGGPSGAFSASALPHQSSPGGGAVAAIFLGRGGIDPPGVNSCLVATTIGSSAADVCPSAASQQLPTRLGPMVRDATGSQAADPPSGGGGGVLPFSGADVLPLMGMGTLLVAGGILVLSMRRRLMPFARVGLVEARGEWEFIDELDEPDHAEDHEVDIEFRHGSEHELETAKAD